jgi:hypothetical protein
MCNHDWQPVEGWYARYRCSVCRVLGCKFGVIDSDRAGSTVIEPYRCEENHGHERCSEEAVARISGLMCCRRHRGLGRPGRVSRPVVAAAVVGRVAEGKRPRLMLVVGGRA